MCRPAPHAPQANNSLDTRLGFAAHRRFKQASNFWRSLIEMCSLMGDESLLFPLPIVLGCYMTLRGQSSVSVAVLAEVFGDLGLLSFIEQLAKLVRARRRPSYATQSSFYVLPGEHFSWPSGHTMRAFFVVISLLRSMPWRIALGIRPTPRLALTAIFFACGTAFARVAKGKHYPSDVVAGAFFGLALGYAASSLRPSVWATLKIPCGILMCIEAIAVILMRSWRTRGFYIHVIIAALWCVSTTLGFGPWSMFHFKDDMWRDRAPTTSCSMIARPLLWC